MAEENELKFIEEYNQLCKKYNVIISACGCCGSPFTIDNRTEEDIEENRKHLIEQV